jgi:3-methyladenine DNA glycosylase AlkC
VSLDPHWMGRLNTGLGASRTLAEILAVDHAELLASVIPDAAPALVAAVQHAGSLGVLARMRHIGAAMLAHTTPDLRARLQHHPSDTVRGWACFADACRDGDLPDVLTRVRPVADDPHFGVREWAWLAVRPHLAVHLDDAIRLLTKWTADPSERIRRFASEALRPRGVWAAHIRELKADPERGLALLEPLRADPSRYVQDSVGNWINDAAKTRPEWATNLGARWLAESPTDATARIVRRALRSIPTAPG